VFSKKKIGNTDPVRESAPDGMRQRRCLRAVDILAALKDGDSYGAEAAKA